MTDLNICLLGDGFVKGIGDPDLRGWAGQLVLASAKELGPITFYNLGIPDNTSIDVAGRIRELVPRFPKGQDNRLILCFGLSDTELNDGKVRISNQASVDALKQVIMKTRGHCKILMVGLPPVYDPQRNNRIKRLNGLYRDICLKAHVPFIDIFSALSEDVQYKRDLVKNGKVYPGAMGYEKVFELIWNDRSWWFN